MLYTRSHLSCYLRLQDSKFPDKNVYQTLLWTYLLYHCISVIAKIFECWIYRKQLQTVFKQIWRKSHNMYFQTKKNLKFYLRNSNIQSLEDNTFSLPSSDHEWDLIQDWSTTLNTVFLYIPDKALEWLNAKISHFHTTQWTLRRPISLFTPIYIYDNEWKM
jgi:hypothetical protein